MLSANVRFKLGEREFHFILASDARVIGLEGKSGVGKSSLLRAIAGLEKRATGLITFGKDTWLDSPCFIFVPPWHRQVGWMPQDSLCFPHLTVLENLLFSGRSTRHHAEDMAEELGLSDLLKRKIRNLSGGERQRVSLGRTLLARPQLLLLDEPFSALDQARRSELLDFVVKRAKEYETRLVLVSHRDEELSASGAERWTVLETGEIVRT